MASTTTAVSSLFGQLPNPDATSLDSKPGKLDADIYLRAAHFAEQAGKYTDAEAKYQQALKVEPKNVDAILGLARLHNQLGNSQQAIATYKQAINLHPKNAKVYNDFGLCYGQRLELAPAQQMLQRAVELEPGKTNYRMNLAVVLVDMGRPADAFQCIAAVQPPGVAHYNLACLFEERGQHDQAADQLHQALAKDPSLTPARELLAQLGGSTQSNMQTVSTSVPRRDVRNEGQQRRDDTRSRQRNPNMQMDQDELQPPVINYGPAAPANGERPVYHNQEDPAAQQQYPASRTSHEDVIEDDEADETTPPTVRISDDE